MNENKKNKYKAKKINVDGITFDSKAEAHYYTSNLKIRLLAREIKDLELQPRFPLELNSIKLGSYVADFKYFDYRLNTDVIEDVKGMLLPMTRLKIKLVRAIHNQIITLIDSRTHEPYYIGKNNRRVEGRPT